MVRKGRDTAKHLSVIALWLRFVMCYAITILVRKTSMRTLLPGCIFISLSKSDGSKTIKCVRGIGSSRVHVTQPKWIENFSLIFSNFSQAFHVEDPMTIQYCFVLRKVRHVFFLIDLSASLNVSMPVLTITILRLVLRRY